MEQLEINSSLSKSEQYQNLLPQIEALIKDETNLIANLANISAALKEAFDFLWVGFYLAENDELVLGPFQGPVACTRIKIGKGVCGKAAKEQKTILVDDVNAFPGHISCSPLSKSEIVIPLVKHKKTILVLDIDSNVFSFFDQTDKIFLEKLVSYLL